MNMNNSRGVKIHDTTLRDGEQMPGVVFGFDEKIKFAEKIVQFGVGLIDIMPVVSESEFRVTRELASLFGGRVSATCRAKKSDVDAALDAGAERVTLFAPLSDLHITRKLGIDREENLRRALEMIDYARAHGLTVDFAGEDSSRSDFGYLAGFLKEIQDKVDVFFMSDTVGCLTPESSYSIVSYLKRNFRCQVGIHMHNDFGMATANTVEGVLAGADYFSGTFTGIGERAGNAPTEEVCAALRFLHGIDTGVREGMLREICGMAQKFSGVSVQRHKPIVGENAFSHESGIHVDGVLKEPRTYEFLDPSSVGHERKIYFGKHSGESALRHLLGGMPGESAGAVLKEIKDQCERSRISLSADELLAAIFRARRERAVVMA